MVEHTAADVVDDAVEVIWHDKAAGDLDIRAENLQQRGGKSIVRMEFSAMRKTFGRDFHGWYSSIYKWMCGGVAGGCPPCGASRTPLPTPCSLQGPGIPGPCGHTFTS